MVSRRAMASRGVLACNRGHRAFVAGVHGLEHVQRFRTAALADDDSFGTHTQGVAHQVGGGDRPLAFDVGRPGLQPHDVVLLQLQFRGVFDRDDAVGVGDEAGQRVEQRRFAGARAAGDDDVQPGLDGAFQEHHHFGREGLVVQQVLQLQRIGAEATNRDAAPSSASGGMMAFKREPSGMRASTIGQVSSTRRPTLRHDAVDDLHQVRLSRKTTLVFSILPRRSHVDVLRAVDQDVADRRILQQQFQRAEAERFVEHFLDQPFALGCG